MPIHFDDSIKDELLVKYLLQETTPEEIAWVEEWLNAGEANRQYYQQFKLIWEESRHLAATTKVDENAAWERFRVKVKNPPAKIKRIDEKKWLRVAAAVIFMVGASWLGYLFLGNKPVQTLAFTTTNHSLADTLEDGSIVTLNRNSTLEYPGKFTGDDRKVSLQGEAFFNVAANKEKPFIIAVNDISIRVVGTSFNVRTENGATEVIVETGIVQVTRNGKTVELRPSEKVLVKQQDSTLVKEAVTDKLYTYYRSKEFVCDNTPLWKLVAVLNEAYDTNIVIGNQSLSNLAITTTFNNESLDNVLHVISETFNIQIEKKNNQIILQ